jgi:hypothetical protein
MASHGRGNHMWPNNAFGLSHDGIEDAIYDSPADRAFAGKDPGREKGPNVSTASGLVHTVVGTIGEVSDVTQAHALLLETRTLRWAKPAIRTCKSALNMLEKR